MILQIGLIFPQSLGHPIEGGDQLSDLVCRGSFDLFIEIAFADLLSESDKVLEWFHQDSREQKAPKMTRMMASTMTEIKIIRCDVKSWTMTSPMGTSI